MVAGTGETNFAPGALVVFEWPVKNAENRWASAGIHHVHFIALRPVPAIGSGLV